MLMCPPVASLDARPMGRLCAAASRVRGAASEPGRRCGNRARRTAASTPPHLVSRSVAVSRSREHPHPSPAAGRGRSAVPAAGRRNQTMPGPDTAISTTQAATATVADRQRGRPAPPGRRHRRPEPGEGTAFHIGDGVTRAVFGRPYEREPGDPLYRPLRIFALDPALSRVEGWVATVNVPVRAAGAGRQGPRLRGGRPRRRQRGGVRHLDLDDKRVVLLADGRRSPSDPLFHQQMVYAVCSLVYAAFRPRSGAHRVGLRAWPTGDERTACAFGPTPEGGQRLLRRGGGELRFGYFRADGTVYGRNLPKGLVFTSLSHDVVAHEVTHALLDGCAPTSWCHRPRCARVPRGLCRSGGDLPALQLPGQWSVPPGRARGESREDAASLTSTRAAVRADHRRDARRCVAPSTTTRQGRSASTPDLEEHALGTCWSPPSSMRSSPCSGGRPRRYLRLATGGTGVLPAGELPAELQQVLAREASQLAAQFQAVCIRAIDYCPPVDIELGEYPARDHHRRPRLVPDDKWWAYREALIDAFRSRGIFPAGRRVPLRRRPSAGGLPIRSWRRSRRSPSPSSRFEGDPGRPASAAELRRQAGALGRLVTRPECLEMFGLAGRGHPRLGRDTVALPASSRFARRGGSVPTDRWSST